MPSVLTLMLAFVALFTLIHARPMLYSRTPSPRIIPGASESLSHWLANMGMQNFDWIFDESPSSSVTPTPTASVTPSHSLHGRPTSSSSASPRPSLHYEDPYASYYAYPSHSHYPSSSSAAVHPYLRTPTPWSSTPRPTATPRLSWGPRPTPTRASSVIATPTPTPSHGPTPTTPAPQHEYEYSKEDMEEDEQDQLWDSFYNALSGRIRDALNSSDELWLS